jgi:3',5'-cyclic AMP phosphodiesterase CpdA
MKQLAALAVILTLLAGGVTAEAQPAADSNVVARVALLSDAHVNEETNGEDATFTPHFEKAIEQVNAAQVDFALIAGDLTQSGKADEYADFKARLKALRVPVWFVPGNHDVGNKVNSGKGNEVTEARVKDYETRMGPDWFSTNAAGVRIIGIDSPLLGSGLDRETAMWTFLERELAAPAPLPGILFMHYPLFVKAPDEPGGIYWNVEPAARARLLGLLRRAGVKIVLTGHLHRPLLNRHDGMFLFTTPPTSFGLPAGKHSEGWTLITVFKDGRVTEAFQSLE